MPRVGSSKYDYYRICLQDFTDNDLLLIAPTQVNNRLIGTSRFYL